ncbi:MAG: MurR/RpiR family transcriptional regulator [Gammaproteobacteria bacterium]|nr:MurR/RpiR family transcriptional regulator [Gammaproteobacteria bacterium]
MSCLLKMRAVREELSVNEKKIADFILSNAALIRDYSSQNLATSVGVSQSSIIKFSQKLNYRGFTDLKLAIHESVVKSENGEPLNEKTQAVEEHLDSVPQQIYNLKHEALMTTMELNDEKRILSAVDILEKSQRIQIVALGTGSLVARNFASMLIQIGKSVIAEVDTYIQLSSIATLGKRDAVVVISFWGQSSKMIQITQKARKAGVSVISLTNYSANPIRSLADVQLFSVKQNGGFAVPQIISNASQQHVLDVLFSLMLKRDGKARELLALSRKAVE